MKENDKKISGYIDQLNSEVKPKEHKKSYSSEEFGEMAETVRRLRVLREPVMPGEEFQDKLIADMMSHAQEGGIPDRRTQSKSNRSQPKSNSIQSQDDRSRLQESDTQAIRDNTKTASKIIGMRDMRDTKKSGKWARRAMILTAAVATVAVVLLAFPDWGNHRREVSIVYAMDMALQKLKAYHGIIEVTETNGFGETVLQSKREVWADQEGNYYLKELQGYYEGLITINNTKKEWQLRPGEKRVYLFPAFPDSYRFTFDLGSEVDEVKQALTVRKIGEEVVSGREAVLVEVTPEGGLPYHLWIDKETDLPLKRQSPMQNQVQITVAYTELAFIEEIPPELLSYQLPIDYEEVDANPELPVTTLYEAKTLTGLNPVLPLQIPKDYFLDGIAVLTKGEAIKLYYGREGAKGNVVLLLSKALEPLSPASQAILGIVNDMPAEFLSNYEGMSYINSIRWQQENMEYTVFGDITLEDLSEWAEEISGGKVIIPEVKEDNSKQPKIEVPVNMEAEESDQKSVDAGHSPWRLDPVFVAQVFANILISPEGIVGDYPIAYENVKIIENNGVEAIAQINDEKSIARYVYLRRLVRKDDTGIWTVVGYDPME